MLVILLPSLLYLGYIIYFIVGVVIPVVGTNFSDIDANTFTELLMDNMSALLVFAGLELLNFIVLIIWIVWMCKDSEPGENKWGPNPKAVNEPEF